MKLIKKREYEDALTYIEILPQNNNKNAYINVGKYGVEMLFKCGVEIDKSYDCRNDILSEKVLLAYGETMRKNQIENFIKSLFSKNVLGTVKEIYTIDVKYNSSQYYDYTQKAFPSIMMVKLDKINKMICIHISKLKSYFAQSNNLNKIWTLKCYVDSESPSTVPLKEKTFSIGLVSPIEFLYSYSKVMPQVLQFGIEAEVKDEFANIVSEMQEKDKKERNMIIDIIKSLKSEKIKINKNNKENVVTCRVTPDPLSGEGVDISIEFYKTGKIIICAPRVMDTSYLMIESNETTYKGTIEAYKKIIARNKLITDAYYLPGGCNDIINAILSNIDNIRVEIRAKSKAITSQKMKVRNMSKKIVKESASSAINNEFSEEDFIKLFNGSDVVIKTDLCVTKYNVSSGNIEKANSYIVNKSLSSK